MRPQEVLLKKVSSIETARPLGIQPQEPSPIQPHLRVGDVIKLENTGLMQCLQNDEILVGFTKCVKIILIRPVVYRIHPCVQNALVHPKIARQNSW